MFPSATVRRCRSASASCAKRSPSATKAPSRSHTVSHPSPPASPSPKSSRPCSIKSDIIPKLSIRHTWSRQALPLNFACAYVPHKMLQQGVLTFKEGSHAFVFSSLFLREEIILPFESVISVEKSKLGFIPNSLTIRTHGGKEYFFTSFLNRDHAYEFSLEQLHQWALHRKHNDLDFSQSNLPTDHTFPADLPSLAPPKYVHAHDAPKSRTVSPRRRASEPVAHQRIVASTRISAPAAAPAIGKGGPAASAKTRELAFLASMGAEPRKGTTAPALQASTVLFMLVTAFAAFCVAMAVASLWAWFKLSNILIALDTNYPIV
ncbi:hypothetical protein BC830DRAFT_1109195 [Chytriomyces sp. MP71]|nr:hypothetical protein BC830DRAFT_1109195 [Chytriomyces sp. MP71]